MTHEHDWRLVCTGSSTEICICGQTRNEEPEDFPISEAMIEAGVAQINGYHFDRGAIQQIYRAMKRIEIAEADNQPRRVKKQASIPVS